jgi:4-amino-4-deoxy-L-arabinose transferase-like glycosyltransferase
VKRASPNPMPADKPLSIPTAWTIDSPRAGLVLVFLLAATLFFANLWDGDLGLDSCAYATISRAMLRTHDWLVPHYEHCREYADCWLHPPLFYWLTALSFKAFGVTEFAARFVAALLGLGTVLLAYGLGRRAGGSPRTGFFSGLVLATTQPFLELGRKCQIDVPLAFFITLAVYFFVRAREGKKCWIFGALAGAATGLALLTKGIPAAAVLVLVVLYALLARDRAFFSFARLGGFLLAMAVVVSLWIVPLAVAGRLGDFLKSYFVDQVWGNFAGGTGRGGSGWLASVGSSFWYLGALAKRYWPWFPFLIVSAVLAVRSWKARKGPVLFLLWVLIVIAGFSAGGTKFYRYLGPVYPGAALLIGVVLGERVSAKIYRRFLGGTALLTLAVLLITSVTPVSFGRMAAPDKTDIKKAAPFIRTWTPPDQPVGTFGIGYWSAVADFAFYVDRSVRSAATEGEFSALLRGENALGWLEISAYSRLSEAVRADVIPVLSSGRFTLVAGRGTFDRLVRRIFPLVIH